MNKKKAALWVFIIAFLVIGVPLIINACYKWNIIPIVTKWGAADVISYYGTLLGTIATIAALVVTIIFTKKQIQHDRFLNYNYMKWEKLESITTKILLDISPLNINDFGITTGKVNVETLFTMSIHLKEYEATVKSSLDVGSPSASSPYCSPFAVFISHRWILII